MRYPIALLMLVAVALGVWWHVGAEKEPELVSTLSWRPRFVDCVLLSPDGRTVACAGDEIVRLWDIKSGTELCAIRPEGGGFHLHLAFSPDARLLATASSRVVELWSIDTKEQIAKLEAHRDEINSVAISPDGKTLASAGDDAVIRLWGLPSCKEEGRVSGQENHVYSLAISADGTTMVWHVFPDIVRVYDLKEARVKCSLQHQHPTSINAIAVSRDGRSVAVGSSGNSDPAITIWDVGTKTERTFCARKSGNIGALAFSNSGHSLIAGCGGPKFLSDDPGRVEIWCVDSGNLCARWKTQDKWLVSLSLSSDNKTLATLSSDGGIRIWDLQEIQRKCRLDR